MSLVTTSSPLMIEVRLRGGWSLGMVGDFEVAIFFTTDAWDGAVNNGTKNYQAQVVSLPDFCLPFNSMLFVKGPAVCQDGICSCQT